MNTHSSLDLRPAGLTLFDGFDTLIQDLTEDDESMIAGGAGSNSNSGRRRKRRRKRRRNRNRSRSRS